jgi:hypothetical protein
MANEVRVTGLEGVVRNLRALPKSISGKGGGVISSLSGDPSLRLLAVEAVTLAVPGARSMLTSLSSEQRNRMRSRSCAQRLNQTKLSQSTYSL